MKIDMSPHAVTMRLKKSSELRRLCIALGGERLKKRFQNRRSEWDTTHGQKEDSRLKH